MAKVDEDLYFQPHALVRHKYSDSIKGFITKWFKMKILLVNPPKYRNGLYVVREECAIGTVPDDFLPSQIFLTEAFLRGRGWDVSALDMAFGERVLFNGIDIVIAWVGIFYSLYDDLYFLKKAQQQGKKTVLILNDPNEGFEKEIMKGFNFIDVTVRLWERELTIDEILSSWAEGKEPDCPGIIIRRGNKIVDNGVVQPSISLNHLTSSSKILSGQLRKRKYYSANKQNLHNFITVKHRSPISPKLAFPLKNRTIVATMGAF